MALLGAGLAQAHDPRLDEAVLSLQKAQGLVGRPGRHIRGAPRVQQKLDPRLERGIDLIVRAMAQIETAGEIIGDTLGAP